MIALFALSGVVVKETRHFFERHRNGEIEGLIMFYILRHGRTDWNEEHRLQGEVDIPLNETGRQMAYDSRRKYKDIDFDICYCSH